MPTPPKDGRHVLAPPLAGRVGDEPSRERRVEERPDHERGHGQGDRCCSGTHAGHGNRAVLDIDEHRAGQVVSLSPVPLYGDTHRVIPPLDVMCCPVCRSATRGSGRRAALYRLRGGLPGRGRDPAHARRPPAGHRGETRRDRRLARDGAGEGWYEPDDEVDAHLPYLTRDLDWEDATWKANEHSFSLLLERYVRPGMRVLEVGAAKAWAAQHLVPLGVEYVATDILADPNIGLGRGAFYEARVGPFARVQADGEHLPFATGSFDLVYCVAALHHALDLGRMVGEMARVTRRGGTVAALNEGTRAVRASGLETRSTRRSFGINEHVHTLYAYLWAFARAGLVVRRVEQAEGYDDLRDRRIAGKLLRLPRRRPLGGDAVRADLPRLLGRLALCPQGRPASLVALTVYADSIATASSSAISSGAISRRGTRDGARGRLVAANPLILMGIYVLVFSVLWKVDDIEHYPLFLLVGLALWLFFSRR